MSDSSFAGSVDKTVSADLKRCGRVDATRWDKVIARLERATGPDRELDGWLFMLSQEKRGDVWDLLTVGEDIVWHRQDSADRCAWDAPARYTASIDAAVSLVPDSDTWCFEISTLGEHSEYDPPSATIWLRDEPGSTIFSYGATVPLAISAVAMKARREAIAPLGAMNEIGHNEEVGRRLSARMNPTASIQVGSGAAAETLPAKLPHSPPEAETPVSKSARDDGDE